MEIDSSEDVGTEKPIVAVYRDFWLPPSEGFVLEPTRHFRRFEAVAIGLDCGEPRHPIMDDVRPIVLGGDITEDRRATLRRKGFPSGFWRERLRGVAIVHAHFGPDALLARHVARDLDVPFVATMHGYDITKRDRDFVRDQPGRGYLLRRRRLMKDAALLMPVSEFLREEMLRKGWPKDRTITHRIGVDTDYWTPDAASVGHLATSHILFVGRLIPLKGADAAIRALLVLRNLATGVQLHIVGDGPERARLEALAAPAQGDVVFHGSQPRDGIKNLLRSSRVVVIPSREAAGRREALNLVALEAAASGVPVVAYDSGGLAEVVRNGVTGFLVEENDEQALANRLRRLLADPTLAAQLGAEGRIMAATEFSMQVQAGRLEALYDCVLGARKVKAGK